MDQPLLHLMRNSTHASTCRSLISGFIGLLVMTGCQTAPTQWRVEPVLAGVAVSGLHGVHGLAFGPDGGLYIGSVMGQSIVRLNIKTGALNATVSAPLGEADDIAFGPDGHMAWTALNQGELRLQSPSGDIVTVAKDLPFVNPVTFGPDGTLYAATLFGPDRLWAYDLQENTARVMAENLGGLNAFEFGPEGDLYTPLPQRQAVGKINVATGFLTVIAEGVGNIVAVKFHPDGSLYGVSWDDGVLTRIDSETGAITRLTTVEPPLDNLAIDAAGVIYVSRSADNGIVAINPTTGETWTVMRSDLAAPGGMAWVNRHDERRLLVTDIFGYRFIDPETGEGELLPFDLEGGASSDVAVRDGKIALTYVRRNRVLLIDEKSGDVLRVWTDIDTPYGVVIEPEGSLLMASHVAGAVIRLRPDDPDRREVVLDGLPGPVGLAWTEHDATHSTKIYISDVVANRVSELNLRTGQFKSIAEGLNRPESMAVLPDGRLAVTNVGDKQVVLINPLTGEKQIIASDLAIGALISRTPTAAGLPTGILADTNGAIYVVTDANNGLVKLVPP